MIENIDTKQSLIKAGIRLFALNPYAEVSVDSIVNEANISKGSFYYYFKSKEEFYKSLLDYAFNNLMDVYNKEVQSKKTKDELLYSFIKAIFFSFEKDKNLFFLIQKELIKIVTGEKSDFLDYQQRIFALLRDILQDDAEIVPYIIMGIVRSSIIYQIKTGRDIKEVLETTWLYIKKVVEK